LHFPSGDSLDKPTFYIRGLFAAPELEESIGFARPKAQTTALRNPQRRTGTIRSATVDVEVEEQGPIVSSVVSDCNRAKG
jgi:hypothetical protein